MSTLQFLSVTITIGGAMLSLVLGVIYHRKLAVQLASVILMIVGLLVIVGYMVSAPQIYTMPVSAVAMALPTGICFFIVGGSLLVLVNEIEFKDKIVK